MPSLTCSRQRHCQCSPSLCIVGETAAFQTDLERLCCCSITLYQPAVSASSESPCRQPSAAANAVFSPLFHLRKAHQEVKGTRCLSGLLPFEIRLTNSYLWRWSSLQCLYRQVQLWCVALVTVGSIKAKKLANHGSPSQLSHRAVKPDASVGRSAEVSELLLTAAAAGLFEHWRVSSTESFNPSLLAPIRGQEITVFYLTLMMVTVCVIISFYCGTLSLFSCLKSFCWLHEVHVFVSQVFFLQWQHCYLRPSVLIYCGTLLIVCSAVVIAAPTHQPRQFYLYIEASFIHSANAKCTCCTEEIEQTRFEGNI